MTFFLNPSRTKLLLSLFTNSEVRYLRNSDRKLEVKTFLSLAMCIQTGLNVTILTHPHQPEQL